MGRGNAISERREEMGKNEKIKMRKRNIFNTKQREHENKIVCLIHNTLDVESNYLALTLPI